MPGASSLARTASGFPVRACSTGCGRVVVRSGRTYCTDGLRLGHPSVRLATRIVVRRVCSAPAPTSAVTVLHGLLLPLAASIEKGRVVRRRHGSSSSGGWRGTVPSLTSSADRRRRRWCNASTFCLRIWGMPPPSSRRSSRSSQSEESSVRFRTTSGAITCDGGKPRVRGQRCSLDAGVPRGGREGRQDRRRPAPVGRRRGGSPLHTQRRDGAVGGGKAAVHVQPRVQARGRAAHDVHRDGGHPRPWADPVPEGLLPLYDSLGPEPKAETESKTGSPSPVTGLDTEGKGTDTSDEGPPTA